jgi:hypothetical protein
MPLPGYAAETSLYRTTTAYQGRDIGYAPRAVIAQAVDCGILCALKWQACNIGCASSGPFAPFCLAGCGISFGSCLNNCPSGGGGGGGGAGSGRVCCERDETGRCVIFKPPNGQCP